MLNAMFDSEQTFLMSFDRKSRRETSYRAEKDRLWQRKWNRHVDRISRWRTHPVGTRKHNLRLIQVSKSKRHCKILSHLTKSNAASSSRLYGGKYMALRLSNFSDGSLSAQGPSSVPLPVAHNQRALLARFSHGSIVQDNSRLSTVLGPPLLFKHFFRPHILIPAFHLRLPIGRMFTG